MRLNELLDDLKLNMTIYSFLGEIMSVIDCGEELNRAPPAYIDRIIRDAHREVNGDIPPQESFRALVEILIKEGCTYSILLSDLPLQCPSAISFHDPRLIKTKPEQCVVFTSDVTFGISDVKSGFHKWSFFSQITTGIIFVNIYK